MKYPKLNKYTDGIHCIEVRITHTLSLETIAAGLSHSHGSPAEYTEARIHWYADEGGPVDPTKKVIYDWIKNELKESPAVFEYPDNSTEAGTNAWLELLKQWWVA